MDTNNFNSAVSQNIKQIREKKKLTLDTAAKLTKVSRSMLAQIEKGDANPTISILWKIANGYKVSFSSLLEHSPKSINLIKAKETEVIISKDQNYLNYPAFRFDEQKKFETYRIIIKQDGYLQSEAHLEGTEEYITVFEGHIEIRVDNQIFVLEEGDSVSFIANAPHSYKNIGKTEAKLSMILYYA